MSVVEQMSALLPDTAQVNEQEHLTIGGRDVVELAAEFGTPLYVFDETTLRGACSAFRNELLQIHADSLVIYAAKAFLNSTLAAIIKEEGLGIDVVSGGELSIANAIDFPMDKVYLHGNNKLREEIELALSCKVGRIVVDNLDELSMLNEITSTTGAAQDILIRLNPGIDAHTHRYVATGIADSKFGLSIALGQAEEAVAMAVSASNINLIGLHIHLGSLIFSAQPYVEAINIVLEFAARMKERHGFDLREFNVGGGFAIPYTRDDPAPDVAYFVKSVVESIKSGCKQYGIMLPKLILEPGRAIAGRAAVAVYRAGAVKDITGVRKYVFVDGGMADNIRPSLYGSRYEALVANKVNAGAVEQVTIAGKYCESGDILATDVQLPPVESGDIIVLPVCGAYCLPMASNYNAALKPAILMVNEGEARMIRRRESFDDLLRYDTV
jgi:diaminopimelate decarboxylase